MTFRGLFRTMHGVTFTHQPDGRYTARAFGSDGQKRTIEIEPVHGVKKGGAATARRRHWLVRVDGKLVTSMQKLEDVAYQGLRHARETKKEN